MKTYKITETTSYYSKKSGTKLRKSIVLKNATFEEVKEFVKDSYNKDINIVGFNFSIPGWLYPTTVSVK